VTFNAAIKIFGAEVLDPRRTRSALTMRTHTAEAQDGTGGGPSFDRDEACAHFRQVVGSGGRSISRGRSGVVLLIVFEPCEKALHAWVGAFIGHGKSDGVAVGRFAVRKRKSVAGGPAQVRQNRQIDRKSSGAIIFATFGGLK
jgi:hypothetical protein